LFLLHLYNEYLVKGVAAAATAATTVKVATDATPATTATDITAPAVMAALLGMNYRTGYLK
jgi:hypothetical protein